MFTTYRFQAFLIDRFLKLKNWALKSLHSKQSIKKGTRLFAITAFIGCYWITSTESLSDIDHSKHIYALQIKVLSI